MQLRSSIPRALAPALAVFFLLDPLLAAAAPRVKPHLPARSTVDHDGNRIDDRLDARAAQLRRRLSRVKRASRRTSLQQDLERPVLVEAVFASPIEAGHLDAFAAMGGRIDHVFEAVSYGWTGAMPAGRLAELPAALGDALVVVEQSMPAELHLDEATRTGRVRPVWAPGFAGQAAGFSGNSDTTIAIVDTGIDESHADLAGRLVYWKDFTSDDEDEPEDYVEHGTHVAGIAAGSGAAFGEGPGILRYTTRGNLRRAPPGSGFLSPIHVPNAVTFDATAEWSDGGSTALHLVVKENDSVLGVTSLAKAEGASPLHLSTSHEGDGELLFSIGLAQSEPAILTRFSIATSVTGYPGVGDGFAALRGVAPGAKIAAAKVFSSLGEGTAATIGAALDALVAQREALGIKVINLSLGIVGSPGISVALRAKVNTAVENGIVVVCSAGNDGSGEETDDPGRAALALTVGASTDANALAYYSSFGLAVFEHDEDSKPDVLAPGGTPYQSMILSADSNDTDGAPIDDRVADDYRNISGTSMSAPFVAGSAALVIEAMERTGTTWTHESAAQPLFVKMLLSASATETGKPREAGWHGDPALGRSEEPKGWYEGYGLVSPDAAVEAVMLDYTGGPLAGETEGGVFDRRSWGRRFTFPAGPPRRIDLAVSETADFDLYLFASEPDAKGNPVLLAASTRAGLGADEWIVVPSSPAPRFLFVKRVAGSGAWSLDSIVAPKVCGDGAIVDDETCDDGNTAGGDCCSALCELEEDGTPCDDGLWCTLVDACTGGVCSGSGDPCAGGSDCNRTCHESHNCFDDAGTPCSPDGLPCTADVCDRNGGCVHPPGLGGVTCRAAGGPCDYPEVCSGNDEACPADTLIVVGVPCRAAAGGCDVGELCTGSAKSCPADVVKPAGATCRSQAGACDVLESCDGTFGACPADVVVGAGTPCTSDGNECTDDFCDGASKLCQYEDNALACEDGFFCNGADTCSGGACFLHAGNPCPGADGDSDCSESCDEAADACSAADPGESCEHMCGDANADGKITAGDALQALRGAIGTSECALSVCDWSGNGELTASDALSILRRAVGHEVTSQCS